jgi:ribosome maturation factor RimP
LAGSKPIDTAIIEATLAPSLMAMGYRIVRIAFTGAGRRATLQVMAEREDGRAMTVDDCAEVSHTASTLLDVADPIGSSYMLEISSPGIDRPLLRREDFARFTGQQAKIELKEPIADRRRFRGRLLGVEGDEILLEVEGEACRLPIGSVARAKLVLTDELIAAARSRTNSGEETAGRWRHR